MTATWRYPDSLALSASALVPTTSGSDLGMKGATDIDMTVHTAQLAV